MGPKLFNHWLSPFLTKGVCNQCQDFKSKYIGTRNVLLSAGQKLSNLPDTDPCPPVPENLKTWSQLTGPFPYKSDGVLFETWLAAAGATLFCAVVTFCAFAS